MNQVSGAKRKGYTGAFKLMHMLIILGRRSGRGVWKKWWGGGNYSEQAWPAEGRPFALPCSMALSSAQDRLGLAFFSSMLVEWVLYLVCDSQCNLHSCNYRFIYFYWWNLGDATCTRVNMEKSPRVFLAISQECLCQHTHILCLVTAQLDSRVPSLDQPFYFWVLMM